jgi:hypothetical protein
VIAQVERLFDHAPRVRRGQAEQLYVGRPPLPGEQRPLADLTQHFLEHDHAVRAKARQRVGDGSAPEGAPHHPGREPARPADLGRQLLTLVLDRSRHDVGAALERLDQHHDVCRVFGEVALQRHDRVALGVVGLADGFLDQPLQRARVANRLIAPDANQR